MKLDNVPESKNVIDLTTNTRGPQRVNAKKKESPLDTYDQVNVKAKMDKGEQAQTYAKKLDPYVKQLASDFNDPKKWRGR